MLIKKGQTAFIRDGRDSASYRLLRNKVQREIRSAKYDYYHHKVSDLEQMDSKKWWKQIKLLTGQDIEHEWYHQFLGENCPGIKSPANMVIASVQTSPLPQEKSGEETSVNRR